MSKKPQHLSTKPARTANDQAIVVVNAYREAFGKHYPQYNVEIKRGKSREGAPVYHVVLNGDKGDRPLTLDDLKEATAAFLH